MALDLTKPPSIDRHWVLVFAVFFACAVIIYGIKHDAADTKMMDDAFDLLSWCVVSAAVGRAVQGTFGRIGVVLPDGTAQVSSTSTTTTSIIPTAPSPLTPTEVDLRP